MVIVRQYHIRYRIRHIGHCTMNESGSILITTLWVLVVLTIFAVSLARSASYRIKFADYLRDKVVSHYLARAGIRKAIQHVLDDETEEYDSLNELWSSNSDDFKEVSLGNGSYTVSYAAVLDSGEISTRYGAMDEERKINVNTASAEILSLLTQLMSGLTGSQADSIGASIIDWRDEDSILTKGGAEDTYYEGLNPPYSCKNKAIESIEELLLIKGITPDVLDSMRDYITVYGEGLINVNTAHPVVLEASGMEYSLISKLILFRSGADGIEGTADDNVFTTTSAITSEIGKVVSLTGKESSSLASLVAQNVFSTSSNNFRIRSQGYSSSYDSGRTIETVVDVTTKDAITVVYWRED